MTARRRADSIEAVRDAIEQQIACAQRLVETLDREHAALAGGHLQELEQACADKLAAATELQRLGAVLAPFQNGPDRLEPLLRQSQDPGTALARWRELLHLAALCQEKNLANGALLDERQARLRWTRQALYGNDPAATYGRSGDSSAGGGRRSLASA